MNIKTGLGKGQGNGPDAAIGIDHTCAGALNQKPVCEALNDPFRLRRIHLNKGGAAEGELDSAELFLNGGNTGEAMGGATEHQVVGLGLKVEADPFHRGPTLHPALCEGLKASNLSVAADQGDQNVSGGTGQTKPEMAQPLGFKQVMVGRPPPCIQVLLERFHQRVQAWIEHRAVVQVDDLVGLRSEVAGLQASVLVSLQRDQGPVAVTEAAFRINKRGLRGNVNSPDALHGLLKLLGFPTGLGGVIQALQGATTAVIGKDAGRAAPICGERDLIHPTAQPARLLALLQLDRGTLPRQEIRNDDHPVVPTGQTLAVAIQVNSLELDCEPGPRFTAVRAVDFGHALDSLPLQWRNTRAVMGQVNGSRPLNSTKPAQFHERCPGSHPPGR